MNYIFIGAPGAGKGTQSEKISKHLSIPKLATGDILRDAIKRGSDLGKKVASIMQKGLLVDDEIVVKIVSERLAMPDCAKGFILDGFPRNISQAHALDDILKVSGDIDFKVILLDVSEDVLIKRISGRFFCKQCNACYNHYFYLPKNKNVCDVCGARGEENFYNRDDDNEASVKKRLEVYSEQTEPLIGYYRSKNCLIEINGEQETESITNEILKESLSSKNHYLHRI